MYKLILIGIVATVVGCGTSNRAGADWFNELLKPSPAGILTGILQLSKPKPTETINYNHGNTIGQIYRQEQQNNQYHDGQVDTVLSQFSS